MSKTTGKDRAEKNHSPHDQEAKEKEKGTGVPPSPSR
jgi:hypothetical protein